MKYNDFKELFNNLIFNKSKADLLEKISKSPYRYVGLFRPTKPKSKILQNLLQSHEIRFGDAFELLIENYLKIKGCEILPKRLKGKDDRELNIDQCFRKDGKIYFIELKVRDDHDSTKKRGQMLNFEKKLENMISIYGEKNLIGICYFIDPYFEKNKNFYKKELSQISSDYNIETQLLYGRSLFDYLGYTEIWEEILNYLVRWKKEIPDLPEINFDLNAVETFEEIKNLSPIVFRNLFNKVEIVNEIILTLFPNKKTLYLLKDYFSNKTESIYKSLIKKIDAIINN